MSESWIVLTPPENEPLSLNEEVKPYLLVDYPDDDALIAGLITRARSYAETVTGRAFAPQTIQEIFTIERPQGGELSGPIMRGPSWYQYQEQLGSNPFGPAQFYYDLAMPPIDRVQQVTIETKVVAFDPWRTFTQLTNPDGSTNTWVDYIQEPARLYIQSPVTANFYRFTYACGYGGAHTSPLPPDLKQCLLEAISFFYDNRAAEDLPQALLKKLLAKRVSWV